MKIFHPMGKTKAVFKRFNAIFNRQSVYVGNNRVLTSTLYGQKLFVDAMDLSLAPHVIINGFWEWWITRAVRTLVKPGMIVVEIGANIGYYTTLFSSLVGQHGHVYAFEANPDVFDILHNNMNINGFLPFSTLENKAVHARIGQIDFHVFEKHQGSSSILPFTDEFLKFYNDTFKTITVPTVSLDDYWQHRKEPIDLIKIDAEGSEPFIFDGMKHILASRQSLTIVCEFCKAFFDGGPYSAESFIDNVLSYGFTLNKITHTGEVVPCCRSEILNTKYEELVFKR